MSSLPHPVLDFLHVVETLFGPKGCPWVHSLELSHLQLTLEEEVHEVIAAYAAEDWEGLSDELGDLLFNVLCIARVMERVHQGSWTDPFLKAADKYRRRSPHVFIPGRELKTAKDVEIQWLIIKEQEQALKGKKEKDLDRSLRELPTIPLLAKVLERVKHAPQLQQKIETILEEPSETEEEQLAKDFMRLAQRAYTSNISLEIAGKKFIEKLLPQLHA